jgi:hypothetical protein
VHWKCIWWMHLLKNVKFVWHLFIHKFVFDSSTHFFCMSNIFSMHDIHMKNIQTYEWTNFARFSLLIWHKLKLWYFFISPYNYKLSLFFKNNSPNAAAVFLWLLSSDCLVLCCWSVLPLRIPLYCFNSRSGERIGFHLPACRGAVRNVQATCTTQLEV